MTPRVGAALDTIGLEQLPTDRGKTEKGLVDGNSFA